MLHTKSVWSLVGLVAVLAVVLPQLYKTWHWRYDHLEMFELSQEFQKNNTNFYAWLGVQVRILYL